MQNCRTPTRGGRPGWRRCATESRRSTGSCPTATASSGRGKGPVAPVPPPDPQGPQPHRPGPPGRTIRAPAAPPRRPRRLKRAHRVSQAQVELRHSDLGLVVRLPVARHRRQKTPAWGRSGGEPPTDEWQGVRSPGRSAHPSSRSRGGFWSCRWHDKPNESAGGSIRGNRVPRGGARTARPLQFA